MALFINGTSLKGKNFAPRGSKFFPLRAVPYGWKNLISTLGIFLEYVQFLLRMARASDIFFKTGGQK